MYNCVHLHTERDTDNVTDALRWSLNTRQALRLATPLQAREATDAK